MYEADLVTRCSNEAVLNQVKSILVFIETYELAAKELVGDVNTASKEMMILKSKLFDDIKVLESRKNILVLDTRKISDASRNMYAPALLFEWLDTGYVDTMSDAWNEIVAKKNPKAASKAKGVNWTNFKSAFSALLTGEGVSPERQEKRLSVCHDCELFRWNDEKKSASCGVCGCKLGGASTQLLDLTRFEETDKYGCKHPSGSRWKENDC